MTIQGITPNSTSATNGSSSQSSQNGTDNLDVSFLNLLITELQSQDPTAPMDATQMVGQMVSLNQLDQLIAIHQILQGVDSTTTVSSSQGGN